MKTRYKTLISVAVFLVAVATLFFVFPGLLYSVAGIDDVPRNLLDIQMEVTRLKLVYEAGEPITFSVNVKALGTFVPWPDFRIYKGQFLDEYSQPVFSRMYMTPFETADRLDNSVQWRERTWNFPLEDDHEQIRFFEEGKYILRVNAWAMQEQFIEFQVIDASSQNSGEKEDDR